MCLAFILTKKLNFLKLRLKEWNKEIFGHLDSKMVDLVDKIKFFDEKEQQLSLSLGDKIERLQVKKELFVVRNKIGIFGLQRVEQHWMEGGDRSTKFFHSAANSRRKFNAIMNIVVEGELNVDDSSMQGAIVHLCEKLCHENFPSRPFVEGISYSSISFEDAWELMEGFFRGRSL